MHYCLKSEVILKYLTANIITVNRMFKFYSYPLFSKNNILKFGDKITSENILFVSKSVDKCLPYFIIGLRFQEVCIDTKLAGL